MLRGVVRVLKRYCAGGRFVVNHFEKQFTCKQVDVFNKGKFIKVVRGTECEAELKYMDLIHV